MFERPLDVPFLTLPPSVDEWYRSQLLPRRVQLRAKKYKKCKECQKFLIKPEPKFQNGKMKYLARQTAWYSSIPPSLFGLIKALLFFFFSQTRGKIPRIVVLPHPEAKFTTEGPSKLLLAFTNPRETVASITLSPLTSSLGGSIVAKSFTLEAHNEYEVPEDEEYSGKLDPGVFQKKGSSTTIVMNTTQTDKSATPKISLQVQIVYEEGEQISFPVHIFPMRPSS